VEFNDIEITQLDLGQVDSIVRLVAEYLCGEKYLCEEVHYKRLLESNEFETDQELLQTLLHNTKNGNMNYEQFNELLLLLNQNRVSEPFFKFFFGKNMKISLEDLKKGIVKFRGFAMLCFGNFRYAYKQLIEENSEELCRLVRQYSEEVSAIPNRFMKRPKPMVVIEPIKRDETWYLGYITQQKFQKEQKYLNERLLLASAQEKSELSEVQKEYEGIEETINEVNKTALKNTKVYLTWDYMDVYIATSMREKWEFEDTFDFVNKLFAQDEIKRLKLRYFDPTQSRCKGRIDKGLVEGLMLKRVLCCIYMAQESDTMGKDSELAATLAQGKPVIAYIPEISIKDYAEKIKEYPLSYFEKRLLILHAEEIFDDKEFIEESESVVYQSLETIKDFRQALDKYRSKEPFSLWKKKEERFKKDYGSFYNMCRILAVAEYFHSERRAITMKEYHPLSIQVDLKSGVANGVLVVRTIEDCAKLLHRILVNDLRFTIKHEEGITVLEEEISGCPYRVVTDDEKLTNSFWNFYLT